jgi:rare lipoprotein A
MRGRVVRVRSRSIASAGACAVLCLLLAHCTNSSRVDPRYGVSASDRVVSSGEPVPKGGGVYRVGNPYVVAGQTYTPQENPNYRAEGQASWYGDDFHGRFTANGEIFDKDGISAAHPTLPLPSYVRVTNLSNGHSLIVRVNDRGPYAHDRIIDVSTKAAHLLGFYNRGTVPVRVEYVGRAPIEGSDDRILEATLREHEPAPPPWGVRLAATSVAPSFPPQPPPVGGPRYGGPTYVPPARSPGAATAATSTAMSFAETPRGVDSVDLVNGRGLY